MGALMRSHDWSRSPLGSPEHWPDTLRAAVATCLSSRFPMVIWWGRDLLMLYNDAWQPILGETKHPAGLGRPGRESWPETWPVVGQQFEEALRGNASWSEDLLLASDRHGYLQECYFTYSHAPLRDATGTVVGVQSVVSETTARVLSERRLRMLGRLSNAAIEAAAHAREFEEACRTLVALLADDNADIPFAVLYLAERDGVMGCVAASGIDSARFPARVGEGDAESWGVSQALRRQEVVTTDWRPEDEPLPGGPWPEGACQVLAVPLMRSGEAHEVIGILVAGVNSRLRLDERYLAFVRIVADQLAGAISTLQSIARERESAAAIDGLLECERAARADAESANRAKDEFLATVSHELRSPIQGILGWLALLKKGSLEPALHTKALESVERSVRLQAQLVHDIIDVSRIVAEKVELERAPLDLTAIVEATAEEFQPDAVAKRIELSVRGGHCGIVLGDRERLHQVIANLLSNALKFTPAGGRATVTCARKRGQAIVTVTDTGEGIEPSFLPRLFERFTQGDASSTRRHGGLGLGLAIVKHLVELHGGTVAARSKGRGRGATFEVRLREQVPGRHMQTSPVPRLPPRLDGVEILLVEDDRDALEAMTLALRTTGASVRAAASASEALAAYAKRPPDVLVSDLSMPDEDGYSLLRRIRQLGNGNAVPAIALTGYTRPKDKARVLAAGFAAHVSKPAEPEALVSILGKVLSGRAPQ
jgi:signal transduction histidine kinase